MPHLAAPIDVHRAVTGAGRIKRPGADRRSAPEDVFPPESDGTTAFNEVNLFSI